MNILRRIINSIIYVLMGSYALYSAYSLRYVPNPSLLTVWALFVFGVMLCAYGAKELFPIRVK